MLKENTQALLNLIAAGSGVYGVSIYHFETEEEFVHLPNEEFYAASIIKIPIMAAVFAQVSEGKRSLSEKITVREEDIVLGDGILKNVVPGKEWSIHDLVVLMIIESDNTATNLLIDLVGLENVQMYMNGWGFKQSQLRHKLQVLPSTIRMLDESNRITPKEINQFLKEIAQGKIISINACRKMIEIMKQQKMNDLLPRLLPETNGLIGAIPIWEMAHKTGYVPGIEHNAGLLYMPSCTFTVTVLSKNIPNRDEAKDIIGKIGAFLYKISK